MLIAVHVHMFCVFMHVCTFFFLNYSGSAAVALHSHGPRCCVGCAQIYGVGVFGVQSYLLFCRGDMQTKPDDCNLKAFAEWQRKHGGGGSKSVAAAAAAPGVKSEEKEEEIGEGKIASADEAKNKKKRRR